MLFSIMDVKANAFGPLFEARTSNEAVRTFLTAIQKSTSTGDLVSMYPQDYCLYQIGDFDVTSGILTQDVQPMQICTGLEAIQLIRELRNNYTSSGCSCSDKCVESQEVELNGSPEEVNV